MPKWYCTLSLDKNVPFTVHTLPTLTPRDRQIPNPTLQPSYFLERFPYPYFLVSLFGYQVEVTLEHNSLTFFCLDNI